MLGEEVLVDALERVADAAELARATRTTAGPESAAGAVHEPDTGSAAARTPRTDASKRKSAANRAPARRTKK